MNEPKLDRITADAIIIGYKNTHRNTEGGWKKEFINYIQSLIMEEVTRAMTPLEHQWMDFTMLVKSDQRWIDVLELLNLPGGFDILRSFKNQLIDWLDQLPGQRRYPESPLSAKQMNTAYRWKTGSGGDDIRWKRKNSIGYRTMG